MFLKNIYNKTFQFYFTKTALQSREFKRWVSPTLKEIRRRKEKLGPQPEIPRTKYIEWNYNSELFAFSKRLNEEFDLVQLQQAFINRSFIIQEELKQEKLGVEEPKINIKDNSEQAKKGSQIISQYVEAFLLHFLHKVPADGIKAVSNFLTSDQCLSSISLNLGVKDLILCAEYPPSELTLSNTLKAIIGTLADCSGIHCANLFIRDFICTQLNQRDLLEFWHIQSPMELLKEIYNQKNLSNVEARLIGEAGKNTVLAVYHIGLYSNKKLIGNGFGETIDVGIETAALNALRNEFNIMEHMKPFNFEVDLDQIQINKSVQQKI